MKQLTNQQLLLIENTLNEKYNFNNFDDLRLEIQDHISIQIEELITSKNLTFNEAFNRVFTKWNPELYATEWANNKVPKLISDLYKKLDLKFFAITFPICIVISIVCFLIRDYAISNFLYAFFATITYLSFFFILYQSKKQTFKTTLNFYATYRFKYYLIAFVIINLIEITSHYFYGNYTYVPSIFSLLFAFMFFFRGKIMYKNIKIENQLLKLAS